jgi:regulatory Fis family protein
MEEVRGEGLSTLRKSLMENKDVLSIRKGSLSKVKREMKMSPSSFGMFHLFNTSEVDELISAMKEEKSMPCIGNTIKYDTVLEYILSNSSLPVFIEEMIGYLEKYIILNILEYTEWNKSRAARILKINYKTLYYKMKKYEIKK